MKPYTHHTLESLKARCVEEGDCLLWQGHMTKMNTPGVYLKRDLASNRGIMVSTRALAHELATGYEIKPGWYYRPTCGNAQCINPEHTGVLSPKQHMTHMARLLNSYPATAAIRAKKIGLSKRKLTDEQIQIIMSDPRSGKVLGPILGVSPSTVCSYRNGRLGQFNSPFAMSLVALGARR
jgi:hypothetical protein